MISAFFSKLKTISKDQSLRKKIGFVLGMLIVFRLLATVPIPGVDRIQLESFLSQNEFLSFLNIFSGGGLSALSVVMLGVGPYITASIIMQLMTLVSDRVKEIQTEGGEAGRKRFSKITRYVSLPIAILQSFGFLLLLQQQGILNADAAASIMIINVVAVTAGSFLLMWVGELATEFGIGNGVSLIIFAGIISTLPSTLAGLVSTYDPSQLPTLVAYAAVGIAIILLVVLVSEAERPIQVTYAKQTRGNKTYGGTSTYLPLRVNQAGVIPIIFAISILLFPTMLAQILSKVDNVMIQQAFQKVIEFLDNGLYYGIVYFVLVVLFTFFYTAVTFDPEQIAKNLQRGGAFIAGVRPGEQTEAYISKVLVRITLVGALFLGFIAVLPLIVSYYANLPGLTIGGTSLLIVVSVVVDLIKKTDAQLSMREY